MLFCQGIRHKSIQWSKQVYTTEEKTRNDDFEYEDVVASPPSWGEEGEELVGHHVLNLMTQSRRLIGNVIAYFIMWLRVEVTSASQHQWWFLHQPDFNFNCRDFGPQCHSTSITIYSQSQLGTQYLIACYTLVHGSSILPWCLQEHISLWCCYNDCYSFSRVFMAVQFSHVIWWLS